MAKYRLVYEDVHGKIEDNWDVHHIDWNHKNDDLNNLIAIPQKVHQLIHNYLGYTTREECELLTKLFIENKTYRKKSVSYLNFKLSSYVDLNKESELSQYCKNRIGKKIERYHGLLRSDYDFSRKNHRSTYKKKHGEIPKNYEIHHIDWDSDNGKMANLIALPKNVRLLIRNYLGYTNRRDCELMEGSFSCQETSVKNNVKTLYNLYSKYMKTNKKSKLAFKCKAEMEYNQIRFRDKFKWRDDVTPY